MDNLIGSVVEMVGMNMETLMPEKVEATILGIIDGPENDPQDYFILQKANGEEIDVSYSRLIGSMQKAAQL